ALKDWESKGQKTFDQIREYINHYVRIGCERLMIELNALVGCSKWPQKFQKLGLDESFIHSCVILAGCIISRLEKLNSVIDEEYINFLEFHQWLQFEFDNMTSLEQNTNPEASPRVDVHKVSSYIKNSLGKDFLNNLEKFFVDDRQSSTISLPTFEFPFSSYNSLDNCNLFQYNSSQSNGLSAYPYDYLSSNSAFQHAPSFESFVNELINRCDTLSSATADNVAKSVKAHELMDIVEGTNCCIDNVFLADMRIVAEDSGTNAYVIFYLSQDRNVSPTLWVLRFPLYANTFKSHTPPSKFTDNSFRNKNGEIACIQLVNNEHPEEYLSITDLNLYDDERLYMIVIGSENDEPIFLTEVKYTELNFISIPEPYDLQSTNEFKLPNVINQVWDRMSDGNFTPLLAQRFRDLTHFKPLQLTTNGARGLIGALMYNLDKECAL
ncbi:8107_t:CDS:2, partial [Racocetra persica]